MLEHPRQQNTRAKETAASRRAFPGGVPLVRGGVYSASSMTPSMQGWNHQGKERVAGQENLPTPYQPAYDPGAEVVSAQRVPAMIHAVDPVFCLSSVFCGGVLSQ